MKRTLPLLFLILTLQAVEASDTTELLTEVSSEEITEIASPTDIIMEEAEEITIAPNAEAIGETMPQQAEDNGINRLPKCIAHRGNYEFYQENSMSGIKSAYEVGSDGVEIDVVETKDKIPLVFHDYVLFRLAKSKPKKHCPLLKFFKDITYKEIQEKCILRNGEEIPTLQEVLEYLQGKDTYVLVELKTRPTAEILQLIESYLSTYPEKVRILSFFKSHFKTIKEKSADNAFWEIVKPLQLTLLLPPYSKERENTGLISYMSSDAIKKLDKHPHHTERGVWTLSERRNKKLMKQALEASMDFVVTNHPELCLEMKKEML